MFVEHFGLNSLSDLPNKEELKASGFLDKRAAIATISDLANNDENLHSNDNFEQDDENNIDVFIQNTFLFPLFLVFSHTFLISDP